MRCLECGHELEWLDNEHLLQCSGLTLHEYAIRHHLPLDLLLQPDQVGSVFEVRSGTPRHPPGERARAVLQGLDWAGLVERGGDDVRIRGEVRRLDQLLWDLEQLADFGFRFRQSYDYSDETHRVVAHSALVAPAGFTRPALRPVPVPGPEPPPAFLDALAVFVAHAGDLQAGYLLLPFAEPAYARDAAQRLRRDHGVDCVALAPGELAAGGSGEGALLRTASPEHTRALMALLRERLAAIPDGWSRFHDPMPEATVTKELVFDAAHFITDHPAKCSNLHGGRYLLQVQVSGRIDPLTGCVVDYGYLKRIVNQLVVERFDHHTLNYAAPELAWRSSTEMICVFVWEQLIDYLPGLSGLRLYETTQSWCDYRGPTLAEYRQQGRSRLLDYFPAMDRRADRQLIRGDARQRLSAVP
jgi:6-pyruvoyl tetrahydropterin synthase/QueD family protein